MILEALILIPILAAAALAFGAPARLTAIIAALVNVALAVVAAVQYDPATPGYQLAVSTPVLLKPEISLAFGLDGLSLVMVLLTVIVTLAAVWASPASVKKGSIALYYASSLLISAGALGAFLATDLFFLYAFHELALIPTFLMIGIFGSGDRRTAAWKITIYLGVGSLVLLAGLAALQINLSPAGQPTFDLVKLTANVAKAGVCSCTQDLIFATLVAGFGILVSLFPFHSWAPQAYACAPTPTAMLHSGVLKKFGLYGLIRVALPLLPEGSRSHWVLNILLILLLGNILYIGLVTVAQKHLDEMLGHSSVMHMGYIFLGIASWTAAGLGGAVLLMVAHGLSIALLFLLNGHLRDQTGTTHFSRFGGVAKQAPFLGLAFGMAAFASIGLPGFANFAGEVTIFFGAFGSQTAGLWFATATVLALWGVVISAVYMLRATRRIFMGEAPADAPVVADLAGAGKLAAILLLVALLVLGFCPNLLLNLLKPALTALTAGK